MNFHRLKNNLFLLIIFSAVFFSCRKNFLERPSSNSYTGEELWGDVNLVEQYVNSLYTSLSHLQNDGIDVPSASGFASASEDTYSTFNYEDVWLWNGGEITPDDISLSGWEAYYNYIRRCNVFLEHIGQVDGSQEKIDQLTGQVLFLRAWNYFLLIESYGGVPIIDKVYDLDDSDFLVERNSYDECVDFIAKDLNDAIHLLPDEFSGNDLGRITKGAAMALKSRVFLYAASPLNNPSNNMDKWDLAASSAKDLIDQADALGYKLYDGDDYTQIFLEKYNPEIILSFGMNESRNSFLGDYASYMNVYIGPNGFHGWSVYVPSQNIVDEFEMSNGRGIFEAGSGYDPANPYVNRDPRFYADILYNGAPFRDRNYESFDGGMDSPGSSVEPWNASLTAYNWRKYADESMPINENLGSNQNWVVFRLAEIYLNYAEAEYARGEYDEARKYLNLVRSRESVGLPDVIASGNELLEKIQNEKNVEFCFEGLRFFDVRRWKIAEETENRPLRGVKITKEGSGFNYEYYTVQERFFEPQHYLFPIPQDEINRNGRLEQNPGY